MADLLFGGLPKGADVKVAIKNMERLVQLNPNYIIYAYDLAKFYDYAGQKANAIAQIKRALTLTPKAPEEFHYVDVCKRFLEKLQNE